MARFVKLSSGQRINLDAIVRIVPDTYEFGGRVRNKLQVVCSSHDACFSICDDRDILDLLKAVDGPQDVPFSECKNPNCPVGCPDSHAATPAYKAWVDAEVNARHRSRRDAEVSRG